LQTIGFISYNGCLINSEVREVLDKVAPKHDCAADLVKENSFYPYLNMLPVLVLAGAQVEVYPPEGGPHLPPGRWSSVDCRLYLHEEDSLDAFCRRLQYVPPLHGFSIRPPGGDIPPMLF